MGSEVQYSFDDDWFIPLGSDDWCTVCSLHGLEHEFHGLESHGAVLAVYEEPVESSVAKNICDVWVSHLNEGSYCVFSSSEFFFDYIFHCDL